MIMKRITIFMQVICLSVACGYAAPKDHGSKFYEQPLPDSLRGGLVVEPWTYTADFESGDLAAWASYPFWQDNAYDQNFQVGNMIPGDSNLSIVARVTPYAAVDNYVGAQKLLDMYLVPGATVSFRYYLKTNENVSFLKVRFAAGSYGKLDAVIATPKTNSWAWATVRYDDFVRGNPRISGHSRVRIYALAFLAKIPHADPAMPLYLGLDDITFKGARAVAFRFAAPAMYKLPAFKPYIPRAPYHKGDVFKLSGRWPLPAKQVTIEITPYTDPDKVIYSGNLDREGDLWRLKPLRLSYPEGLYLCRLVALNGMVRVGETQFTLHIAPGGIAGRHPRLLFDSAKMKVLQSKLSEKRFQPVYRSMLENARDERKKIPLNSLIYDLDQFPDENWLPSWEAFGEHIYDTGPALEWNSLAYAFHHDTVAGDYVKDILLKLSQWPTWVSPWLIRRGRFSEHRMGTWSHRVALAYDLTYDLMTPGERVRVRKAIMEHIIKGAYRTYVYDDNVISNTSNWIGHIVGGALMNMAAIEGDGPRTENMEPYFTGSMMKLYAYLSHVTCRKGGAWGEGLGYNNYTFSNLSFSVPSIFDVFNIDVTGPLAGTYNEYIWAGLIKDRKWFGFGDTDDSLEPATNWAFLLDKRKAPRLSWYYHFLKDGDRWEDVLFNTDGIVAGSPFHENPVKVFPEIGTTVFKSGWDKKDFVFVMRTGAFYNHQHLDQGSFYLADRGIMFIEDQPIKNSSYYTDPLYQSRFIQPVAHSTILVDHNPQSQRTGDPLRFAPGFDDHAFIRQFLDSKGVAFSSGDIGRLYWGKVSSLTRNVLYLKPRTLLMLDVAAPARKDVDITLLYHTAHLKDIDAGRGTSKITKDGYSLHIIHLAPDSVQVKAVETPHFLNTLLKEKPLVKEGMLTVTGRTEGHPLVMANLLTTTVAGAVPDVAAKRYDGFVEGNASGRRFAFSTRPGKLYRVGSSQTDALAITWNDKDTFAAMATLLRKDGKLVIKAGFPLTFDLSADSISYYAGQAGNLMIGVKGRPSSVTLAGKPVTDFSYDRQKQAIIMKVPKGKGLILIR
jgi:hypothetical protein